MSLASHTVQFMGFCFFKGLGCGRMVKTLAWGYDAAGSNPMCHRSLMRHSGSNNNNNDIYNYRVLNLVKNDNFEASNTHHAHAHAHGVGYVQFRTESRWRECG